PPPPLIGQDRGGRARHWPLGQRSRSPLAAGGCHSGRRRPGEAVRQPGPSSAGGGGGGGGTMYGFVNHALELLVIRNYGPAVWEDIKSCSGDGTDPRASIRCMEYVAEVLALHQGTR
ncbi:hypothetical protein DV515_00002666, partial [Chloebia gouldiae]